MTGERLVDEYEVVLGYQPGSGMDECPDDTGEPGVQTRTIRDRRQSASEIRKCRVAGI